MTGREERQQMLDGLPTVEMTDAGVNPSADTPISAPTESPTVDSGEFSPEEEGGSTEATDQEALENRSIPYNRWKKQLTKFRELEQRHQQLEQSTRNAVEIQQALTHLSTADPQRFQQLIGLLSGQPIANAQQAQQQPDPYADLPEGLANVLRQRDQELASLKQQISQTSQSAIQQRQEVVESSFKELLKQDGLVDDNYQGNGILLDQLENGILSQLKNPEMATPQEVKAAYENVKRAMNIWSDFQMKKQGKAKHVPATGSRSASIASPKAGTQPYTIEEGAKILAEAFG